MVLGNSLKPFICRLDLSITKNIVSEAVLALKFSDKQVEKNY